MNFFRNFLAQVEFERNSGLNFFSPFLCLSHPVLAINIAWNSFFFFFFKFFEFLSRFFSEFSCPGQAWVEFRTNIFLFSFLAYLIPFWLEIMPKRGFFIFCYFFRNFIARVEYERNSGLKFFSPFLGLSHPVWASNISWNRFFNLLNFFAIFFRIFLPQVELERNSGLIFFFFLFLGLSHPVSARNNAEKRFFDFLNFFAIFFGI